MIRRLCLAALCVAAATLLPARRARAIMVDVRPGTSKCFGERVIKDQVVVAAFAVHHPKLEDGHVENQVSVRITGPDGREEYTKEKFTECKHAFTASEDGRVEVCVALAGASPMPRTVELTVSKGAEARDYAAIAKEEHLRPLETQMRRLQDQLVEVAELMDDMRLREAEMRSLNERTNARVWHHSCFSVLVLLSLGFWQIRYLQGFLKDKKLI